MTIINRGSEFKEYSPEELITENMEVLELTMIEREWISEFDATPYATDYEILKDADRGRLQKVSTGIGYLARGLLRGWSLECSNPNNPNYYSPPYLGNNAFNLLQVIAKNWQAEMGDSRLLSVPSVVRSLEYQQRLALKKDALTIKDPNKLSSHTVGWAFDIDACGIYETDDSGVILPINPRTNNFNSNLVIESRIVLREILSSIKRDGYINYVEELPASDRHCFHVCVKPEQ